MTQEPRQYVALPRPISLNHIFRNVPGKGRVRTREYRAWAKQARELLDAQPRLRPYSQPVSVGYCVGEIDVGRMDAGNVEKAYTDALVAAGLIHDDSRYWLRSVTVRWIPGMRSCVAVIEPSHDLPETAAAWIDKVPAGLREIFK